MSCAKVWFASVTLDSSPTASAEMLSHAVASYSEKPPAKAIPRSLLSCAVLSARALCLLSNDSPAANSTSAQTRCRQFHGGAPLVNLRRVKTRHAFARSSSDSVTHKRTQCQSERLCRNRQTRSNEFPDHALTMRYHLPNSKPKFKAHRSDRVRRKR